MNARSRNLLAVLLALGSLLAATMAASASAAPSWGISMTHQNAYGVVGKVDPFSGSGTDLARQSGANRYKITVSNTGDETAGGQNVGVGQSLTCTGGPTSGATAASNIAYQWLRNGLPIGAATARAYTIKPTDVSTAIQCEVTATNEAGGSIADSQAIVISPASATPPPAGGTPTISGTPTEGNTLTCNPGVWGGAPTFTYQWLRDGSPLDGAVAETYVVTADDSGSALQCRVLGVNAGGGEAAVTARALVLPPVPTGTTSPSLPATASVGQVLTCSAPAGWSNGPTFSFQWLRNGAVIPGATTSSYTLTAADESTGIQCFVIGENSSGGSAAASVRAVVSPPPSTQPPKPLAPTAGPKLSGSLVLGSTVNCSRGLANWSPAPVTYSFQWLRNGVLIPGTESGPIPTAEAGVHGWNYTIAAADVGKSIQCEVTGTNAGGASIALSASSGSIAAPASPVATVATSVPPSVVVAINLPPSLVPREGGILLPALSGSGWVCNRAALTCSRSDAIAPGAAYPTVEMHVHVEPTATDLETPSATVSGGGASPPSANATDPTRITPAVPYGIAAFTTSVLDEAGHPYTQAGGHPFSAATKIAFNTTVADNGNLVNAGGDPKEIETDLPPGFLGNPQAVRQCPVSLLTGPTEHEVSRCPAESAVGFVTPLFLGEPATGTGTATDLIKTEPIYALVPRLGTPAQFGFTAAGLSFVLDAELRSDGDYGVTIGTDASPANATIDGINLTFCASGVTGAEANTACAPSSPGAVPFLTLPTECSAAAPAATLRTTSYQQPDAETSMVSYAGAPSAPPAYPGHDTTASPDPTSSFVTGCGNVLFNPTLGLTPTTVSSESPTGLGVDLDVPQTNDPTDAASPLGPDKLAPSALKDAIVTLPSGVSASPSAADGLLGCTDAQAGRIGTSEPARYSKTPANCPDASEIGTARITTPLLARRNSDGTAETDPTTGAALADPIDGQVFLMQPRPGDFSAAGGTFRLLLQAHSDRYGLTIKLPGTVTANKDTGQLTATFQNNPQLPFSKLHLDFFGGPRAALATPITCGSKQTTSALTPWSSSNPATPGSQFEISSGPNGSPCAATPEQRPFGVGLTAGSRTVQAGSHTAFDLRVTRNDGEQEISSINATMPRGFTARLAGVPYCPDSAIAAASGRTGQAERAEQSCPASSQVGTVETGAGPGSNPYYVPGNAYLAGPYKGAPLSLAFITPAVAGPFDLGNVVVRAALYVDPETAQVSVRSDPIPQILDGVPLRIRDVRVHVDRPDFALNPTNCEPASVASSILGNSGATATPSNRFQVSGCDKLAFKPKLKLQLKGATGRTGHPALTAEVTAAPGEANISTAQVNLPGGEFLDQGNLNKTCTRPVLMAGNCPASTVYGHATAYTPLLEKPLEGDVYLVGGYGYKLPALVAELNGQIRVLLVGRVDSGPNKGIRNTFEMVPDAPVSRFVLEMKGGKKYGLLQNSENLCKASKVKRQANVRLGGQNGKVEQFKPVVANQCGKKKHAKKSSDHASTGSAGRRVAADFREPRGL